jgi:hypothetical protein
MKHDHESYLDIGHPKTQRLDVYDAHAAQLSSTHSTSRAHNPLPICFHYYYRLRDRRREVTKDAEPDPPRVFIHVSSWARSSIDR